MKPTQLLVKSLRQEIADLKEELSHKPQVAPTQPDSIEVTASTSMTILIF